MTITNTEYHRDLSFEDYLNLPGTSFSGIKGFEGDPTPGMRLGTRVHAYLNEPKKYDWQQAALVTPIAKELRAYLGESFKYLEKEIAFTADFMHNGMLLKYKGRADMLKIGRLVVDIKVLSGSLTAAIERFGYARQVSGYCLATGAVLGLIVAYNKQKQKVEVKSIKPSADWWEYQCVRLGEPVEAVHYE